MKTRKRITVLFTLLMMLVMNVTSVMAEEQAETVTYNGHKIECELNCTFYYINNDRATASSSWDGVTNCKVSVMLFSCPNAVSSYKMIDEASDSKKASVSGSKSSVWKFKSQHYGIGSNGAKRNVCVLTDW